MLGGSGSISDRVVSDGVRTAAHGESIGLRPSETQHLNVVLTGFYEVDTSVSPSVGADVLHGVRELPFGSGALSSTTVLRRAIQRQFQRSLHSSIRPSDMERR